MLAFRVIGYNILGERVKDFEAEVGEEDGAAFVAHQVLHIHGVTCCEILTPTGELVLRQCDPGVEFDEVVGP